MIQNEKNRVLKKKPLLLFSPLDWGLGHTTRSIPILKAFQEEGWQILVACDSTQKTLLEQEIYGLQFTALPGYKVSYSARGRRTRVKILAQLINILMEIKRERHWLRTFLAQKDVQAVLSDNRYGFNHTSVPGIFITHQLQPRTGFGRIADRILQRIIYRYIKTFSVCWVPDNGSSPSLSGELGHPKTNAPLPVRYIGPLSRLTSKPELPFSNQLLVIISGPEPQRTVFETLVFDQLSNHLRAHPGKIVVVRGLPGRNGSEFNLENVTLYDHVDSTKLSELISKSEYVLCRSGYTSLMDLVKLKKKMILMPTPGQPEQEYLAAYFQENGYAVSISQSSFSLTDAWKYAKTFSYGIPEIDMELYRQVVKEFSSSLVFEHPGN